MYCSQLNKIVNSKCYYLCIFRKINFFSTQNINRKAGLQIHLILQGGGGGKLVLRQYIFISYLKHLDLIFEKLLCYLSSSYSHKDRQYPQQLKTDIVESVGILPQWFIKYIALIKSLQVFKPQFLHIFSRNHDNAKLIELL